jgi:UDP-N-acetylmuramate: L-alanyl-gamma-D-glutamyl-meso-diaminopimelate ligase
MVLEGDEYLSSPIDRRPKFHLYKPHIALLSGIAWDHINVFPTFDIYLEQFREFIRIIEKDGTLIYCTSDAELKHLCEEQPRNDLKLLPYSLPPYEINQGKTIIGHNGKNYPLQVFGQHNLLNLEGARNICNRVGIDDETFYEAIMSFKGASNRLELLSKSETSIAFKDFAHAPSKLKATTLAVREQYPRRKLIALMELHTYSSLSKEFLEQYNDSMRDADVAIVYYNPHALALKRLPDISPLQIKNAFGGENLTVINDANELKQLLLSNKSEETAFLFMSSGNFGGLNLQQLAQELTH